MNSKLNGFLGKGLGPNMIAVDFLYFCSLMNKLNSDFDTNDPVVDNYFNTLNDDTQNDVIAYLNALTPDEISTYIGTFGYTEINKVTVNIQLAPQIKAKKVFDLLGNNHTATEGDLLKDDSNGLIFFLKKYPSEGQVGAIDIKIVLTPEMFKVFGDLNKILLEHRPQALEDSITFGNGAPNHTSSEIAQEFTLEEITPPSDSKELIVSDINNRLDLEPPIVSLDKPEPPSEDDFAEEISPSDTSVSINDSFYEQAFENYRDEMKTYETELLNHETIRIELVRSEVEKVIGDSESEEAVRKVFSREGTAVTENLLTSAKRTPKLLNKFVRAVIAEMPEKSADGKTDKMLNSIIEASLKPLISVKGDELFLEGINKLTYLSVKYNLIYKELLEFDYDGNYDPQDVIKKTEDIVRLSAAAAKLKSYIATIVDIANTALFPATYLAEAIGCISIPASFGDELNSSSVEASQAFAVKVATQLDQYAEFKGLARNITSSSDYIDIVRDVYGLRSEEFLTASGEFILEIINRVSQAKNLGKEFGLNFRAHLLAVEASLDDIDVEFSGQMEASTRLIRALGNPAVNVKLAPRAFKTLLKGGKFIKASAPILLSLAIYLLMGLATFIRHLLEYLCLDENRQPTGDLCAFLLQQIRSIETKVDEVRRAVVNAAIDTAQDALRSDIAKNLLLLAGGVLAAYIGVKVITKKATKKLEDM